MGNMKREFIINDLMVQDFIIHEGREILLMETDETGKSELRVRLTSDDNLCIANMDKKRTECWPENRKFDLHAKKIEDSRRRGLCEFIIYMYETVRV